MKKRKTYSSLIKWAFAIGKEIELIPLKQRRGTPKQTIWQWRNLEIESIIKLEEEINLRQEISDMNDITNFKIQQQFIIAATKIQLTTIEMVGINNYHKLLAHNKATFVKLIEKYSEVIDKDILLKWFKLNTNKFAVWQSQVNYDCDSSVVSLCAKKYTNQTTLEEYQIIEKTLNDIKYQHWPKSAVHSMLLKKKKLIISRSTFYKYASQIKPSPRKGHRRRKNKEKLRAKKINELWHFDISYFRTLDGKKHYIYAIIDNYSRKILEWKVKSKIRNKYVAEMLLKALGVHKPTALRIMSDGGSENVGQHVKIILQKYKLEYGTKIKHMIALKDIDYSNNMIERFFRIMKSNYLYMTDIENGDILLDKVNHLMYEYNYLRPHYSHHLLTPHEVYIGVKQPDLKIRFELAKQERIHNNKNCSCTVCTCSI